MILEEIREWHTVNTVYDDKAYHTCWMCDKGGLIQFKDLRLGRYHQNDTALEECRFCQSAKKNKNNGCCGVFPCNRLFEIPLPM